MRKSIAEEVRGLRTPRQRVWASIRTLALPRHSTFTRLQVQDGCSPMVPFTTVEDFMQALTLGGYIEHTSGGEKTRGSQATEWHYKLTAKGAKQGDDAPLITSKGTPAQASIGTLAMWRAMKVLPSFDFHALAKAATLGDCVVKPQTAKTYLKLLDATGYLATVRKGKPGTATVFRLDRNTGPLPPAITRAKVVFDRNTGQLVPVQNAQEVCDGITD